MKKIILLLIIINHIGYSQSKLEFMNNIEKNQKLKLYNKVNNLSKKFYKKFPTDTLAIIFYANSLQDIDYFKNKKKIIRLYDELIKLDTNNANYYSLKSTYYLRIEDFSNGILYANKSISKNNTVDANLNLALLYEGKLDTINANNYFKEAFSIDSNNTFLNYKFAYTMFYRKDYKISSSYFIKFIELINKNSESDSYAFVPDLIISLWNINEREKALYYWKTYSKHNEAHYNYRFSNNSNLIEIKKYCEANR